MPATRQAASCGADAKPLLTIAISCCCRPCNRRFCVHKRDMAGLGWKQCRVSQPSGSRGHAARLRLPLPLCPNRGGPGPGWGQRVDAYEDHARTQGRRVKIVECAWLARLWGPKGKSSSHHIPSMRRHRRRGRPARKGETRVASQHNASSLLVAPWATKSRRRSSA